MQDQAIALICEQLNPIDLSTTTNLDMKETRTHTQQERVEHVYPVQLGVDALCPPPLPLHLSLSLCSDPDQFMHIDSDRLSMERERKPTKPSDLLPDTRPRTRTRQRSLTNDPTCVHFFQ